MSENKQTPDSSNPSNENTPKQNNKRSWIKIIVLLLLLLATFIVQKCLLSPPEKEIHNIPVSQPNIGQDTSKNDTSISKSLENEKSSQEILSSDSKKSGIRISSSLLNSSSSLIVQKSNDSIPPQLVVSPPSGRFIDEVNIQISCPEKKCTSSLSVGDSLHFSNLQNYTLKKSAKIFVKAVDSAQNTTQIVLDYQIVAKNALCDARMVAVGEGKSGYCIDEYEWPNRKGEKAQSFVSWQNANDSCTSLGKNLCSAQEWQQACSGIQKSKYPYGQTYSPQNCASTLAGPERSGKSSGCRSWYGAYDMAGNMWEWTSTPAKKGNYYLVVGGNWQSSDHASCQETKYSFYPQNQYPMVSFRCCSSQK
jgi:hypothetical protein